MGVREVMAAISILGSLVRRISIKTRVQSWDCASQSFCEGPCRSTGVVSWGVFMIAHQTHPPRYTRQKESPEESNCADWHAKIARGT